MLVPAALDCNDGGERGWAVLRGVHNPPEVVAFCWSREAADEVYQALRARGGAVWLAPAFLTEDAR